MRAYLSWHQVAVLIALTVIFAILYYLAILSTAVAASNLPIVPSLAIFGPAT